MKKRFFGLTAADISIWGISAFAIVLSFCLFDRSNYLILGASLIGVTSLIFNAKGNPIGQVLMVIFSIFYGFVSYGFAYYGEMITYLGMTAPMSVFALISWLRHPYGGEKSEVAADRLKRADIFIMTALTCLVTVAFYFILAYFKTANLIPSTVSVTTSFVAVYLTYRRSPYFALAYGLNDIILIILWGLAAFEDFSYISVIVCFVAFLANDIYGFISWLRMAERQRIRNEYEKTG